MASSSNVGDGARYFSGASGFSGSGGGGGSTAYGMAYRSVAFDIPSVDTWADVPLTGGNANLLNVSHSTSVNPERVTVNASGIYLVSFRVHNIEAGGGHHVTARLFKNGSSEAVGSYSQESVTGTNEVTETHGIIIASLSSGDYLTLQVATNLNYTNEVDFVRGALHPPFPTTDITAIMVVAKLA